MRMREEDLYRKAEREGELWKDREWERDRRERGRREKKTERRRELERNEGNKRDDDTYRIGCNWIRFYLNLLNYYLNEKWHLYSLSYFSSDFMTSHFYRQNSFFWSLSFHHTIVAAINIYTAWQHSGGRRPRIFGVKHTSDKWYNEAETLGEIKKRFS